MNRTLMAAAAAAFATLATFGASQAATSAVETSDLDLATPAGQAKLESRIDRAVRAVCSEAITGSRISRVDKGCMAQARASIEKQVAARRAAPRNGG
jgi:UrcA family protein